MDFGSIYFCEQNVSCDEDAQNIPQGSSGFHKNHKDIVKMCFESEREFISEIVGSYHEYLL